MGLGGARGEGDLVVPDELVPARGQTGLDQRVLHVFADRVVPQERHPGQTDHGRDHRTARRRPGPVQGGTDRLGQLLGGPFGAVRVGVGPAGPGLAQGDAVQGGHQGAGGRAPGVHPHDQGGSGGGGRESSCRHEQSLP